MTSDSEHTNKLRPPQQAQSRKWPILVLLLGVVTLALALTACGGESSSPDGLGATSATTPWDGSLASPGSVYCHRSGSGRFISTKPRYPYQITSST